ncbi:MAG: GNAT family N-acetyltransferase [Putridiphycobacter sp.]
MSYFTQQSERLNFRKLTELDITSWVDFFIDNDRLAFMGIDLTKSKETLAEEWIRAQFKRYETQKLGFLAVELKSTGQLIGLGGILPREINDRPEYEIAYSLLPKYWGQGYATEIAKTMKNYGCKDLNAQRLISIIHVDNIPSAHVAKKNGMDILFSTEYLGMPVHVYGTN